MGAIFTFLSGAALLIFSAEKLIGYLVGIASRLNISIFLLAIVFTGIEFDDIFLGVTLNVEDLGGVALGTVFGTAISLTGIVLALAAILTPTAITIPRNYLVIFAVSPLVLGAFVLKGPLTTVDGIIFLGLFALFICYVAVRESRGGQPVFRDAEMYEAYAVVRASRGETPGDTAPAPPTATIDDIGGEDTGGDDTGSEGTGKDEHRFSGDLPLVQLKARSGWISLALAVLAIAGLVVGSATVGIGTKGILRHFDLDDTLFGATIATLVLSIEDIFLTVEPVRKGAPEIGVGNVIGSVVFSLTGKLGIILLAGGVVVGSDVLSWHLPVLIVLTGLAAYFLSTGRLRRWHGFTLLGLYVAYWIVSFGVFDGIPVDVG
jgi:cation:H+ antiporter